MNVIPKVLFLQLKVHKKMNIGFYKKLPPKLRLFFPIIFGIILSISLITFFSYHKLKSSIYQSVERNLSLEVRTLSIMLEREYDLKLDKVKTDLKIASSLFKAQDLFPSNRKIVIRATNQITGQVFGQQIYDWQLGGKSLYNNNKWVDEIKALVGGTATIFQKSDSGFIRISTNVLDSDKQRAVGTFIPNQSPVVQHVMTGKTYIGRAYVVNDWYITAYEPIFFQDEIIGMLYVGDKEKDLSVLQSKIKDLNIGENGYPFVLDREGKYIIHPTTPNLPCVNDFLLKELLSDSAGVTSFIDQSDGLEYLLAWRYFEAFDVVIAAKVPILDETRALTRDMLFNSLIIALIMIVALAILTYFVTTENIRKFLRNLELSSKKLKSTEKALEQSEQLFQTLFNNSSDEIFVIDFNGYFLEVNQVACEKLGYSHEEFLQMHATRIKPEHLVGKVQENITMIKKFGQHRYESENLSKSGQIIPVEMNSRVIDFKGKNMILTIARDISERKEMEDKILSAIIQTEENERKRFAADLHDDLGPILSAIKLYTDLLKKGGKNMTVEEAIQQIEELVDQSIESTRTISRNIRPNILQDFGLAAAIHDFSGYIQRTASIHIDLSTENYSVEKRGIEETVLYQAVKELINNTLKHSGAKNIKIELKSIDNQVILYYRDDGNGFDFTKTMQQNKGLGLYNIMNKIKSIRGKVDIHTEPGHGMFLIASLKLKTKN